MNGRYQDVKRKKEKQQQIKCCFGVIFDIMVGVQDEVSLSSHLLDYLLVILLNAISLRSIFCFHLSLSYPFNEECSLKSSTLY